VTDEKFRIVAEPRHCLLRITMREQWTIETVAAYKAALLPEVDRLLASGCARGNMVALVDARHGGAQSQDVIAEYQRQLGGSDLAPRRLATLVSSALFKRQIERIAIPNQRLFTDEDEALAWLLSPDTAA
jgi:hypothetical protein